MTTGKDKKKKSNGSKPKKASGTVKMGRRKGITTLAANTGRVQGRGEKDGRMGAARQAATDKAVKKAGGTQAYLKKAKEVNSRLVKAGNKYVDKTTAYGKGMIRKHTRKTKRGG